MADVLRAHWSGSTHTDVAPPVDKCDGCGAAFPWGDLPTHLAAHQAAALSAAGFGPVREARAEAWDQGMADMLKLQKAGPGYEIGNPYRKDAQ